MSPELHSLGNRNLGETAANGYRNTMIPNKYNHTCFVRITSIASYKLVYESDGIAVFHLG